ncbi:MAG TPA: hypothetical protein VMW78_09945 [Anaerolineae bacterium]|nr:hypothetical protein [Anaerolineae bacterium]
MKTAEELRKMMKDKRYSGSNNERDASFIKEVEDGFVALNPLREVHPERVSEAITSEYEARREQLSICGAAITEAKSQVNLLESQIDKIEQGGDLKKIRKHLLLLEETGLYLNILEGRKNVIGKLSAEANERYRQAVEVTHPCFGCKCFVNQNQKPSCIFKEGKPAVPTSQIDQCPDPAGQMLDKGRPIIGRGRNLPSHGEG